MHSRTQWSASQKDSGSSPIHLESARRAQTFLFAVSVATKLRERSRLVAEEKSRTVISDSAALARWSSAGLGRRTVGGEAGFGRCTVGGVMASTTEDCGGSTTPDSVRGYSRPGMEAGGSRTVAGCGEVLSASNGSRVVQPAISDKSATGGSSATGARGTTDVFMSIRVSCKEAIQV